MAYINIGLESIETRPAGGDFISTDVDHEDLRKLQMADPILLLKAAMQKFENKAKDFAGRSLIRASTAADLSEPGSGAEVAKNTAVLFEEAGKRVEDILEWLSVEWAATNNPLLREHPSLTQNFPIHLLPSWTGDELKRLEINKEDLE